MAAGNIHTKGGSTPPKLEELEECNGENIY